MINIFIKLKVLLVFANKNLRVIIEIYVLIPCHDFFFKQTKKSTGIYLKIICIRLRHQWAVWTSLELYHKRVRLMSPLPRHSLVVDRTDCFHVSVDLQVPLVLDMMPLDKPLERKYWRELSSCFVVFEQHRPHTGFLYLMENNETKKEHYHGYLLLLIHFLRTSYVRYFISKFKMLHHDKKHEKQFTFNFIKVIKPMHTTYMITSFSFNFFTFAQTF